MTKLSDVNANRFGNGNSSYFDDYVVKYTPSDVRKANHVDTVTHFGGTDEHLQKGEDGMNIYEAIVVDRKTLEISLSCYLVCKDETEANQKAGIELYKQAQIEHEYSDDENKELVFDISNYAVVLRLAGKFQN